MEEKEVNKIYDSNVTFKDEVAFINMSVLVGVPLSCFDNPDFDIVDYIGETAKQSTRKFIEEEKEGLIRYIREKGGQQ